MSESCRIVQGAFDRWFLMHPTDAHLAWSGMRWVEHDGGIPTGEVQVCNFSSLGEAVKYTMFHGMPHE
jgi:hypothetical protein